MGSAEGGSNRSLADRDRRSDRSIVEIGVVAEKQHETLPLGELLDRRADEISPWVIGRRRRIGQAIELVLYSLLCAGVTSRVHDDLPDPSLQVAPTLEAVPLPHCPHEGLVDDVRRELRATNYGCSDTTQLRQPSLVHRS
jgi:hypothetical protein